MTSAAKFIREKAGGSDRVFLSNNASTKLDRKCLERGHWEVVSQRRIVLRRNGGWFSRSRGFRKLAGGSAIRSRATGPKGRAAIQCEKLWGGKGLETRRTKAAKRCLAGDASVGSKRTVVR